MAYEQGYDVLRLIEHSESCYVSSEYVRGRTLIRYIREEKEIEKEQLFAWMRKMAGTLACVHKCRGAPCYQYVNPYSMIIAEDEELYFLDLKAASNQEMLIRMQKRTIREHFLPEEELKQALEQTALLLEEKEDAIYYRCVLKGYTCLDAKEQREELLRLGIQYRALGEKEGQEEVTQWMAMAYEQNGKKSDAAKMYEELLAVEGKRAEREELYRKVTELFLADKKNDDAMRRIREGVTEYPDSVELQVLKLRVTCKEKEKNRRACRKALERAVKNRTDIQKNEDFRKLLQEQGFQMKGEKVCEKE